MTRAALIALVLVAACGNGADSTNGETSPEFVPPVPTDGDIPVQYPPELFARGVGGDVVLRLFVDDSGRVVADSGIRVESSSTHARMDTAAINGVQAMRYAPARRHGVAVATWFLQPVQFRPRDEAVTPGDSR